jgi:cellulose synthase (UDP-forming)
MPNSTTQLKKVNQDNNLQNVVKIYLLASIAAALFYFSYLFNPVNIGNIYTYLLLVVAELYIFIQSVGTWYTMLHVGEKRSDKDFLNFKRKIVKDDRIDGGVAVFVTVAGEPLDMLQRTLEAALKLRIQHQTYLLDDLGDLYSEKNEPYKNLAKELGVKYLKTENNNLQKIGSLNYGLKHIKEKYFANFDADFIPEQNFLIETLPYFIDEELGWVQTPQAFRDNNNVLSKGNSDAVESFYQYTMPAKNAFNAALFVGTNTLFRKKALDSIGGFQYHHSEDVFTGYSLHQAGWKSIAIPNKLAYGICPDDTLSLFKQSLRWSGGTLEIFLYDRVFNKNLTADQKFQYFITFSFYLYGVVILIMIILPIIYLLAGVKPLQSIGAEWAIHYIPYFIFQFSTIALFASKLSPQAILVSMNLYPVYIKGLINAIRRKHSKWVATNLKTENNNVFFSSINGLYWHFLVAIVSIIALIVGVLNVRESMTFAISAFWVVVNLILTLLFIRIAVKADLSKAKQQ